MKTRLESRFEGAILGLAIGDALGWPTEFLSLHEIHARFGPEGVTDFVAASRHPPGTYTDDTQMSIAVAEALIEAGRKPLDVLMPVMARRFVEWARSPENDRAPGTACMAGCRNLASGKDWRTAGNPGSKGCGSAMRAAPIGLYYHGDLARVVEVGCASSLPTHGHRTAIAAAAGTAVAVALLVEGAAPQDLVPRLLETTGSLDGDCAAKIRQVLSVLDKPPAEAMRILGDAWVGEEALADALYCFLRSPDDYRRTVLAAANSNGDSDSIACIAGAMSGAFNGIEAIPDRWRREVENADYLTDLAKRLYAASIAP